jgi:hypothetical protein
VDWGNATELLRHNAFERRFQKPECFVLQIRSRTHEFGDQLRNGLSHLSSGLSHLLYRGSRGGWKGGGGVVGREAWRKRPFSCSTV